MSPRQIDSNDMFTANAMMDLSTDKVSKCPYCGDAFFSGKEQYCFLQPVGGRGGGEGRKLFEAGRRHCRLKHPTFVPWNLMLEYEGRINWMRAQKFKQKVDGLVRLSLANATRFFPLDPTKDVSSYNAKKLADILLERVIAAIVWVKLTCRRNDKGVKRCADAARQRLESLKLAVPYFYSVVNTQSPLMRINLLQSVSLVTGLDKQVSARKKLPWMSKLEKMPAG